MVQSIIYRLVAKNGLFGELKNNANNTVQTAFADLVVTVGQIFVLIFCLFGAKVSHADSLSLQSVSIRAHVSEQTLLGEDAPENFEQLDISASFTVPWLRHSFSDFDLGTRLMTSTGFFRGADKNALVFLVIPNLYIENTNNGFTLDLGAGGAALTRHRFGAQDFGGPLQFALTLGISMPVYEKIGIGYRFLHYSDAGINGSDTTGADIHMVELFWNF